MAGTAITIPRARFAPEVFVASASGDDEIGDQIFDFLQRYKIDTWWYRQTPPLMGDWADEIYDALRVSKVFVCIVSGAALRSENFADEIALAREFGVPIVPFFIEDVELLGGIAVRIGRFQRVEAFKCNRNDSLLHLYKIIRRVLDEFDAGT